MVDLQQVVLTVRPPPAPNLAGPLEPETGADGDSDEQPDDNDDKGMGDEDQFMDAFVDADENHEEALLAIARRLKRARRA